MIEELEALVNQEDVLAVSRELNELKARFDDYILEEEHKNQVALLEAQEKGEDYTKQICVRLGNSSLSCTMHTAKEGKQHRTSGTKKRKKTCAVSDTSSPECRK